MEIKTVKKTYKKAMPTYYAARGNAVEEEPMTVIVVVKHDGCDRLFHFTYYRRIKANTEVLVHTKYGEQTGIVQGSFLIPTRQLEYFFKAYGIKELKTVIGTIETVTTTRLVVETDQAKADEIND